jgi:hypothetical protein
MAGSDLESFDINRVSEFSINDRRPHRYEQHLGGRKTTEVDQSLLAALRPKVQEDIVREADGIVFVTTHNARIDDRGVPMINQAVSAGAIYIVRNPLDIAISLSHFRELPIDQCITDMETPHFGVATEANLAWIFSSWSENVKSWTERRHPAVLVVRYEDLIETPVDNFTGIANHTRQWPTQAQLKRAIELTSLNNLQTAEREAGFKEKLDSTKAFFREGRAGQWREVLTPAQIDRIVSRHGEQMARFGYLPD